MPFLIKYVNWKVGKIFKNNKKNRMTEITLQYKRKGLCFYKNSVDESKKIANEIMIREALSKSAKELSQQGAYIVVWVERDGKTFKNEVNGIPNPDKYNQLIKT